MDGKCRQQGCESNRAESLAMTVTSTVTVAFAVSASTNAQHFVVQVGSGALPVVPNQARR